MILNGDRIYDDTRYQDFMDRLFSENARLTQEIMAFINKIPFKKLRSILIKAARSNKSSRLVASLALRNVRTMTI